MRCCQRAWMMMAVVCLLGLCAGCPSDNADNGTTQSNGTEPVENDARPNGDSVSGGNGQIAAPPPFAIPPVVMTEAEALTCRVKQGDEMPDAPLADLAGGTRTLAELREGKKLTVVCFWQNGDTQRRQDKTEEILQDLQDEFFEAYADKGVQVIGVNVGDPEATVRQRIDDTALTFPTLLDPNGSLFAEVTTAGLPRVYLLDSTGKIVWFDIEFSGDTRRILEESIKLMLKGG